MQLHIELGTSDRLLADGGENAGQRHGQADLDGFLRQRGGRTQHHRCDGDSAHEAENRTSLHFDFLPKSRAAGRLDLASHGVSGGQICLFRREEQAPSFGEWDGQARIVG